MRHIFLTGATGVLGTALLRASGRGEAVHWHCLVRARNLEHLQERKDHFCARHAIDPKICTFYLGDVQAERFGLGADDWQQIKATCPFFIHAAGQVKLNLPKEEARQVALDSARTVLELFRAVDIPGKHLLFVSTVGVAGQRPGLFPEEGLEQSRFHNTYEEAKYWAEKEALQALSEGVPLSIVRPSMIVGEQDSGHVSSYQVFYHLADFFAGLKTGGALPDFVDLQLDIIPCDVVATAMLYLLLHPQPARIFHFAAGSEHAPLVKDLQQEIRSVYAQKKIELPTLRTVPDFYHQLPQYSVELPEHREFHIGLHYILPYLADRQIFENTQFRNLLKKMNQEIPEWKGYLENLLKPYFPKVTPFD